MCVVKLHYTKLCGRRPATTFDALDDGRMALDLALSPLVLTGTRRGEGAKTPFKYAANSRSDLKFSTRSFPRLNSTPIAFVDRVLAPGTVKARVKRSSTRFIYR